MSKVMIVSLVARTFNFEPIVMSWDEYVVFASKTSGEGETWKAKLI